LNGIDATTFHDAWVDSGLRCEGSHMDGAALCQNVTALLARLEELPPDPQAFIPGYRVRFIELDNACAFLVANGWAGGIPFDEAVKVALTLSNPYEAEEQSQTSRETGMGVC
jgi:hypothetical protein